MPRERSLAAADAVAKTPRVASTTSASNGIGSRRPTKRNDPLALHRLLDSIPLLSSYRAKLFVALIVAALVPPSLGILIAMLGTNRMSIGTLAFVLLVLGIAAGAVAMWLVNRLLAPLDAATEALDAYAERLDIARIEIGGTDTAAQVLRGVQSLIARLKSQDEEKNRRDERDETSGVYRRRAGRPKAQAVIDEECKRGRAVRVVAVRIDGFGALNDTYGYGQGDALLKAIGARVARVAGEHGVAVRWSGDEFMIVRGIAVGEPAEFEQALARSIVLRGVGDPITLSLGVAQTDRSAPFETLAAHAAEALVAARRQRVQRRHAANGGSTSDA